jgi:dTDP-L-rhamnose 4-epimerase
MERPIDRLIVASSMSIYGEGLYRTASGRLLPGRDRPLGQLQIRDWEVRDDDGVPMTPVPTPETKAPALASVYALSKYDQERLCLMFGRAYRVPTVALRFFNVYGPRQALSNPYTGVLAIFASRLLGGRPPRIFEDGLQQRDFVNVLDLADACRLALESPDAPGGVFNIGSGEHFTVHEIARRVAAALGRTEIEPDVVGQYRVGDIRHCFADISLARRVLGYAPRVTFEDGLADLVDWLQGRAVDSQQDASSELSLRGLTV